uniref:Uncharacterized protein n=1 Tax=Plectus sambesii TaxID=2011161 RepID=A0A914V9M4_9BILA
MYRATATRSWKPFWSVLSVLKGRRKKIPFDRSSLLKDQKMLPAKGDTAHGGRFSMVDNVDWIILSCVVVLFVIAVVIGFIYILKVKFFPREHYEPVRRIVEAQPLPTMRYAKLGDKQ